MSLAALVAEWERHKEAERAAVEARREIEDAIVKMLEVPENLDGTKSLDIVEGTTLRITGRIDRKVDGDKAQEIAAEHGLQAHLPALFRWKPEINLTAWKNADPKITAPFNDCIVSKPGRPSFAVVTKKAST
jgi:hypothetical protein